MTCVCIYIYIYKASDGKPKRSRTTPCVRDLTVAENKLWLLWLKMLYFNRYIRYVTFLVTSRSILLDLKVCLSIPALQTFFFRGAYNPVMSLFPCWHVTGLQKDMHHILKIISVKQLTLDFLFFITITRNTFIVDLFILGTMKPINRLLLIHAT